MDFNEITDPCEMGKENSDRLWQVIWKSIFSKKIQNHTFKDEMANKQVQARYENKMVQDYIEKAMLIGIPIKGHGRNPEF